MENISVNEFCIQQNIEISFDNSLQNAEMIEMTPVNKIGFIKAWQLQQLEKFIRLYYELEINRDGIETIFHLLKLVKSFQDEVNVLKNRLLIYEMSE
jgi:hypothetical protein